MYGALIFFMGVRGECGKGRGGGVEGGREVGGGCFKQFPLGLRVAHIINTERNTVEGKEAD